jgi:hypothetical protein
MDGTKMTVRQTSDHSMEEAKCVIIENKTHPGEWEEMTKDRYAVTPAARDKI